MKTKKIVASIAAVILSASMGITVFAANVTKYANPEGNAWWYSESTGFYYLTRDDALDDTWDNGGTSNDVRWVGENNPVIDYNDACTRVYQWYNSATKKYYKSNLDATNANPDGVVYNQWDILTDIDYNNSVSSTYKYYCTETRRYYRSETDASNDALYNFNQNNPNIYNAWDNVYTNIDYSSSLSSTYKYYCVETRRYYKSESDADNDALYNFGKTNPTIYNAWNNNAYTNIDYSNSLSATYRYYCEDTRRYYRTRTDASNDALYNFNQANPTIIDKWNNVANIDYRTTVSSTYRYYCSQTNRYYRSRDDASNDALYNFNNANPTIFDAYTNDYATIVSAAYPWYSSYTKLYYRTQVEALAASNNNANYVNYAYGDYLSTASATYPWYSSYTKRYYRTQVEAITASLNNSSYVSYAYGNSSSVVSATYPWYSSYTKRYYKTQAEAIAASLNNSTFVTYGYLNASTTVSATYPWYSSYTKLYYKTQNDALKASNNYTSYVSYAYTDSSTTASSTYPWYSDYTKRYYKTKNDALLASNNYAPYVRYAYTDASTTLSETYPWYSSYTKKYYRTQADAIADSSNNSSYVSYAWVSSSTTVSATYPWYSSSTKKYYKTQADAILASGNNSNYVKYAYSDSAKAVSSNYQWFSSYTRRYYKTKEEAIKASNNNSVYVANAYNVASGTPFLNGYKQYNGWELLSNYVTRVKSGSTIAIRMNGAEVIDSSMLEALDGTNVNVQFVLKNGVIWTINGNSVGIIDDLNIASFIKNTIPASAINPYKKNAVSIVRLTLGDNVSLDMDAKISVKYATSRAGRKAYVYYYDEGDKTLTNVAVTKVTKAGYCSFVIDEGGQYIIILK